MRNLAVSDFEYDKVPVPITFPDGSVTVTWPPSVTSG